MQKVNHWIRLDLIESSHQHLNFLQEDLKKFDEYDTFNIAEINKIKIMRQVQDAVEHSYAAVSLSEDCIEQLDSGELEKMVRYKPSREQVRNTLKQFQ